MHLVELARKFVDLSDQLEAVRGEIARAVLNGAGPRENPTSAARPGAKGPQSNPTKALRAAEIEGTILGLVQSSPGLRTAAIMKATSAQRSTTNERLKRLQSKGLLERDGAGWRASA